MQNRTPARNIESSRPASDMLRRPWLSGWLLAAGFLVVASGCAGRGPFSWWSRSDDATGHLGGNTDLRHYQHPAAEQADRKWSLMPWAREVSHANHAAAQQSQSLANNDPLSLRNTPKNLGPDIFIRAAQLYEAQGNFEKSAEYYQKALDESPNDEQALMGFARLYDRQGDFEQAIAYYQRALKMHPQSAALRNDMGICFARWGRTPQSLDMLQQAIQLQPNEALYRNNIAKVLVQAGRPDEALPHLQAVFPPAAAHYNLGYLLYEHKQHEIAVAHFQQALAIDPAFARAARMISVVQGTAAGGELVNAPHPQGPILHGPQLQHPAGGPQPGMVGVQQPAPRMHVAPRSPYANAVPGDGSQLIPPDVHVPR